MKFRLGTDQRSKQTANVIGAALGTSLEKMMCKLGAQITIEAIKPRQTDPQRGYYWQAINAWGKEIGYDAEDTEEILHNEIKCRAYGVAATVRRLDGTVRKKPKKRSRNANRDEYSDLIEVLLRVAAENDYYIESPRKSA